MERKLGQIAVGYIADIVATDEDPTKNIKTMESVSFVMKEGKIIEMGMHKELMKDDSGLYQQLSKNQFLS
jgi:ABC-type bacteriocin/lantibiotic exporter with double-glycine peptidase domain